jgi:hypothetical protein
MVFMVGFWFYLAVFPVGVRATCIVMYEVEPILPDNSSPGKIDGYWQWPADRQLRLKALYNESCCAPGGPCSVSKSANSGSQYVRLAGDANNDDILQTSETWTYHCLIQNITDTVTNSAGVTGSPPIGIDVNDTAQATVQVTNEENQIIPRAYLPPVYNHRQVAGDSFRAF